MAGICEAHAAGEHYYLVVAVYALFFGVLKSEERAADEGLAELVAEVRSAVGSFNEDVGRRLIEPFALLDSLFAGTHIVGDAWVRSHVHGSARQRKAGTSAAEAVADFAAATRCRAVKWFYRCGEVVSLCLERYHGVDSALGEERRLVAAHGRELECFRSFYESHIIFIGRYETFGVDLAGALDELE